MKHQWETPKYKSAVKAYLAGEERVCKNCGKKQTLEKDYAWGRVISRKWRPLVGKCKVPNLKPCPGCKHKCKYRGGAYYCPKCGCWWVDILELSVRPDSRKGGKRERTKAVSNVRRTRHVGRLSSVPSKRR